jgi:hypothetical protein
MLDCGCADLRIMSKGYTNIDIMTYLHALFSALEDSTNQAELVLQ